MVAFLHSFTVNSLWITWDNILQGDYFYTAECVIENYFSTKRICCGYSKEPSQYGNYFSNQNMLIGMKIMIIFLLTKFA